MLIQPIEARMVSSTCSGGADGSAEGTAALEPFATSAVVLCRAGAAAGATSLRTSVSPLASPRDDNGRADASDGNCTGR